MRNKVASDCLSMEVQLVLELFFKLNSLLNNKQNPSSGNIKKTSLTNLICLRGIYKDRNKPQNRNYLSGMFHLTNM